MSIIDKALEANRNYAKTYDPTLGKRPAPKIVVVTCMDPRLSDLPRILGLPQADFGSASDLSGSLRFVGLMLGIRSRRTMRWSRIRYRGGSRLEWSDLGEPQRVMAVLSRLGIHPEWAAA